MFVFWLLIKYLLATASIKYTQVCKEFLQQNANSFLERSAIVNKRLRRTQFMRKQELEVLWDCPFDVKWVMQ